MPSHHTIPRKQYKYAIKGAAGRDDFLLKVIIGMLGSRTTHAWVNDENNEHVWIIGDEPFASVSHSSERNAPLKIKLHALKDVGANPSANVASTNSQFNAQKIADALNAAGAFLQKQVTAPPQPSLSLDTKKYRLNRWPSHSILNSSLRKKTASLMLGSPLTINQLKDRSTYDLPFLEQFIEELRAAAYIIETDTSPDISQTAENNVIQVNLATQEQEQALKSKEASSGSTSIFAKIRSRLSMSIFSKT